MLESFQQQTPSLGDRIYLHPSSTIIGNVSLGDDCSVWPSAVIRADVNSIQIGKRTNIQDQSVLHVTHASQYNPEGASLSIGDDVTIGHRVTCHGCQIGARVLIGIGSIILDRAIIQEDVMIGAQTLVLAGKILKSGYLYVGSPAKVLRQLTKTELKFLRYSAERYVQLKEQYRNGCSF